MDDPQIFIDRMLEVENLTDALEDEDAEYLINWGVARLKEGLGKIEDREAAGEYTNNLMGFMRTLNQISGDLENIRAEDLAVLADHRQKTFGAAQVQATETYDEVATRLKGMKPRQVLEYLLQANLKKD
jgi:hypothetical protein